MARIEVGLCVCSVLLSALTCIAYEDIAVYLIPIEGVLVISAALFDDTSNATVYIQPILTCIVLYVLLYGIMALLYNVTLTQLFGDLDGTDSSILPLTALTGDFVVHMIWVCNNIKSKVHSWYFFRIIAHLFVITAYRMFKFESSAVVSLVAVLHALTIVDSILMGHYNNLSREFKLFSDIIKVCCSLALIIVIAYTEVITSLEVIGGAGTSVGILVLTLLDHI